LSRSIDVEKNVVDRVELVRTIAAIQDEILLARFQLVENHANDFGEDHLDKEVGNKVYVSVAGGGGGSGLVYVGAYKLLEDHGIRPRYIVGTSIGSIIGMFRSLSDEFDVAKLVLQSRQIQLGLSNIFLIKPSTGKATFGLPAAIRLDLYPAAEKYFRSLGREVPTFESLKTPFEAVVCGIKRGGLKHDPSYYAGEAPSLTEGGMLKWRPSTLKWLVRAFNTVAREFTNPEMLTEVVFGRDKYTKRMKVVDGVGFSCAIPGMLHYDIFRRDESAYENLKGLMSEENLAFLVDGGLVNNVPSRIAWRASIEALSGRETPSY